ncbi:hypothetical protein GCM10010156_37150 [Planobispora rosea]|uniref:Fimbrial assembly family protein n=1 Tax=Planobispora rosea TaxID=35762 RepID=A0A8J3RW61_PLARO|nr:hypothetical protein [Planobispora rosea]GGS74911.1 hypothetical protein GCM10010156_37150 [Planobispora rosea]GIH81790.1 hypothetical protein Pro02_01980 [Planobispora rosea]
MTTTLIPQGSSGPVVPAQDPFRALPLAADLLPPEIMTARRGRRARTVVLSFLTVFTLLLAGWYVITAQQTAAAEQQLAEAEDEVRTWTRKQKEFSELVTTRGQEEMINAQLSALLARDVRWSRLLSSIRAAAPSGVRITSVASGLSAEGSAVSKSALPNTSGKKLIGELSIVGVGSGKQVVADYVSALSKVSGLGNPLLNDATEEEGGVNFTVQVDITDAALDSRYPADVKKEN